MLPSTKEFANLESMVREFSRFVFKVAYGVLRNNHDAEDVVQEVFLRAFRAGTRDVSDLRAWLATLAFRIAIDRTRKAETAGLADLEPVSAEPDAERLAMRRQQVEQVQRLIAALPDELRHPLVLSAVEDLNSRQIAQILDISESAVRGRIFRARALLKEKLAAITGKTS